LSLPGTSDGARSEWWGRLVWVVPAVAVAAMAAVIAIVLVDTSAPRSDNAQIEVRLAAPSQPADQAVPDPALVEQSPDGALPIIGQDGRQAWQVYARHFDAADHRPRIALVVSGLGLDADATRAAIAQLPPAVTLAFSPYTHDLPYGIAAARKAGHEVLIGLPMEPAEYPLKDPGPETLLTSLDKDKNLERLRWVMGRGAAYVGLVGIMGDRFTGQRDSLEPVLDELKSRGLIYVDDHDASKSLAGPVGHELGMEWAVTDRTIDDDPAAPSIDKALADLETVATQDGAALGIGGLYPVTLDRILAWSTALDAKGIALAPSSAVATRQTLPPPPAQ
jgi:uncharacterized protein